MFASKFTMLLILCIGITSSLMTQVKTFQVSDAIYLIKLLSWKNIVIVHDSDSDERATELVSQLEQLGGILFTVVSMPRSEENDFLHLLFRKHLYKFMNIVRLIASRCSSAKSRSYLVPPGTSEILLNTKSKWLIFPSSWCSSFRTSRFQTNLTNVAVVIPFSSLFREILILKDNTFESVLRTPTDDKIFPNIRYKLNGQKIRIGIVPGNPLDENYRISLLDVMRRYLNFTYEIVNSTKGEYGILTNGSWSGLMGQLVDHEIDLGLTPLTLTLDRRRVVDFVHPIGTSKPGLLYKKELMVGDSWFLLTRPLQLDVYLCTILSFICVSLFFIYLSNREYSNINYNRFASTVEFVLAALLLEGGNFHLKGNPARILFAFWLLFGVVLAATYTATLLRSLVPQHVKPFETIQDLLDLPDWQIGVMGSTSDMIFLNTSENDDVKLFWKSLKSRTQMDANIQSIDIHVHMKRVFQGKYAFVSTDGGEFIKIYGDCSLEFNDRFFDLQSSEFSMAVPKGSLLKTELDDFIDKIKNTGLLEEIMKLQDNRPSQCSVIDETVKPLFLDNVKGVFVLLVGGAVIAGITLIIENVVQYKCALCRKR